MGRGSGQGVSRSGEVREGEGPIGDLAVEAPFGRAGLGRATVALDACRGRREDDGDPGLPASRAVLLGERALRRHALAVGRSRGRLRDHPITVHHHRAPPVESPLPSNPCGRVLRKKAPKEQPPRNLSGQRTAQARQLWRADHLSGWSHRRGKPALRRISQVPRQRGKSPRHVRDQSPPFRGVRCPPRRRQR